MILIILALCLEVFLFLLALAHLAMPFCKGKGGENMKCSIPGIEEFARNGFHFATISSFMIGLPYIIIFLLSVLLFNYFLNSPYYLLGHIVSWISLIPVLVFGGFILLGIYVVFFT
jgi:hypothetical protein